eukprot:TRINITY_DN41990_c0_g1_i1.p1 TRINITY_DN41990_c0_g1~~TRINITY_DN41990_c0_g1_i1.p1  ORF type:complete len:198 (-),score=25.29 TRINITY_DN41990_c0_g1_i1:51-644(-)
MLTGISAVASQLPRHLFFGNPAAAVAARSCENRLRAAVPQILIDGPILPGSTSIPIDWEVLRPNFSLPGTSGIGGMIEPPVSSSRALVELDGPGEVTQIPVGEPMPSAATPLECRYSNGRRKSQGLEEKWWLEYDPPKSNYISGFGRGPHGGNSIGKKDWPRQMVPIRYKQNWQRREKLRYAFRKHGFELDVPKFGG